MPMDIDQDKVDQAVLALLSLGAMRVTGRGRPLTGKSWAGCTRRATFLIQLGTLSQSCSRSKDSGNRNACSTLCSVGAEDEPHSILIERSNGQRPFADLRPPGWTCTAVRQRPGAATFWRGCFWGYRYPTEIRNRLNCRCFLHDFESVPGSHKINKLSAKSLPVDHFVWHFGCSMDAVVLGRLRTPESIG